MAKIKCTCGNVYDVKFNLCTSCALENPFYKPPVKEAAKPQKKSLHNIPKTAPTIQPAQKKLTISRVVEEDYEDYEDDFVEELEYVEESVNEDDFADYEDEVDEPELIPDEPELIPDEPELIPDEPELIPDEPELIPDDEPDMAFQAAGSIKPKKISKAKPMAESMKSSIKKVSETTYNPNHDGYYDDRLPAILDEITKTSHMDVIFKIGLAVVCIAALITYCIFYVQV